MGGLLWCKSRVVRTNFQHHELQTSECCKYKKPLVLVGKRRLSDRLFSKKVAARCQEMKSDMAGGAAVLG
jgi:leucyl aminopeptidase